MPLCCLVLSASVHLTAQEQAWQLSERCWAFPLCCLHTGAAQLLPAFLSDSSSHSALTVPPGNTPDTSCHSDNHHRENKVLLPTTHPVSRGSQWACYNGTTAASHPTGIHSVACKSLKFLFLLQCLRSGTSPEADCFWRVSQRSIQPCWGVI